MQIQRHPDPLTSAFNYNYQWLKKWKELFGTSDWSSPKVVLCVVSLVIQSCPTLCNPLDCSQAPLSLEVSRQGYWNGLLHCRWTLYHLSHQGSPKGSAGFRHIWSSDPVMSPVALHLSVSLTSLGGDSLPMWAFIVPEDGCWSRQERESIFVPVLLLEKALRFTLIGLV